MDRLPETLLTRVLILSGQDQWHGPWETRRLGRLASLARFMAVPARAGSWHTVVAGAWTTKHLIADPSVARYVRIVRLDAQQREKADWFRSAEEEPEEDWRERIELWRSDVEAILRDAPAARRLVLGGSLDALDQATVQLIAEIPWTTVSIDLSAGADDDASGSFEMRPELRVQLLAGISGHVQALDLCCLHVGRFPDDDIGSEPDERSPFTVLHWPQLRSLSVGHVDQALVTSIVRNAPMLCELGTHPDTGWGLFGGPAIEERGGQIRQVTIPRATHIEDQIDIRYLEHCPSLARLDWDFQWLVLPSNLLDGVGPGLDTLVLRIACANDIIAASGAILIGLRSARWQLRALELVVSSSRRLRTRRPRFARRSRRSRSAAARPAFASRSSTFCIRQDERRARRLSAIDADLRRPFRGDRVRCYCRFPCRCSGLQLHIIAHIREST